MAFNLDKLISKEKIELPIDQKNKYIDHYKHILLKYGYNREDCNAEAFDKIAEYLAIYYAWKKGECSSPKGLFLFGPTGTGKTKAFNILSGLFDIDIITIDELARVFSIDGGKGFWDFVDNYRYKTIILDDFLADRKLKYFGNEIPISEFIRIRYRLYEENGILTFINSNAPNSKIVTELYGSDVMSRIFDMCEFVKIEGRDRRIENCKKKDHDQRG